MKSVRTTSATAVLAACLSLAACGGSPSGPASAPATGGSPSGPASAPPTSGAPYGQTSAPATSRSAQPGKVSANTAGESEIAAALKAAGVPNPERWAKEVVEYRPYPAGDDNLTSLRQNLAKYNPGEETVNKIVSALTP